MILIRIFRICAITEAITWVGLLASMYEKYIAHTHQRRDPHLRQRARLCVPGLRAGRLPRARGVRLVEPHDRARAVLVRAAARDRSRSSAGPTTASCGRRRRCTLRPPLDRWSSAAPLGADRGGSRLARSRGPRRRRRKRVLEAHSSLAGDGRGDGCARPLAGRDVVRPGRGGARSASSSAAPRSSAPRSPATASSRAA